MEKAHEPDVDFPDAAGKVSSPNVLPTQVALDAVDIPNPTRSNAFVGAGPLCEAGNELPTFIRHSISTPKTRSPNFVRRMNSLSDCADSCRRNVEPVGGKHFPCHGFIYTGKSLDRSCEFFDSKVPLVSPIVFS